LVQIYTLGEHAVVLQVGSSINMETHERVMAYTRAIQAANFPWVIELVPAYNSVTVYYSIPTILQIAKTDCIATWVTNILLGLSFDFSNNKQANKKIIEIPACYDTALGVDIIYLSEQLQLGVDKIIDIHSDRLYTVYMLGFLPGFPYMGSVDERIQHPRKKHPSKQVIAGSIGIAGAQTGIYPLQSPGGWQIIARTPLAIFDLGKESPCLFAAGDQVRFVPISLERFYEIEKENQA
jgi:inhibitor of KinA